MISLLKLSRDFWVNRWPMSLTGTKVLEFINLCVFNPSLNGINGSSSPCIINVGSVIFLTDSSLDLSARIASNWRENPESSLLRLILSITPCLNSGVSKSVFPASSIEYISTALSILFSIVFSLLYLSLSNLARRPLGAVDASGVFAIDAINVSE